jgi:hypothetical protein
MTDFKKTIAAAKATVADAETKAFMARLEAIDAILQGATPHDVALLCAHVLAGAAPLCCEAHQDEFKADFLRMLGECIAVQQEQAEAEADESDEASPPHIH